METETDKPRPAKRKPAAPPTDTYTAVPDKKPANDLDWSDEKLVKTLAKKFTDSEAMPYAVWARIKDNDGYMLNQTEYDALVVSWDTTLTLVGPDLPLGLIAAALFLTAHLVPVGMRFMKPPENPDKDKAKRDKARAEKVKRAKLGE